MPRAVSSCRHLSRRHAGTFQLGKNRRKLPRSFNRFGAIGRREAIRAIAAKPNPTRFSSLQCGLCPLRNHLPLMFGDGRENMQSEPRRMRIIDSDEFDA